MAKRTKRKQTRRAGKSPSVLRAKVVRTGGGGARLVFKQRPNARKTSGAAQKAAATKRKAIMRSIADSSRTHAAASSKAVAKDSARRRAQKAAEARHRARTKKTKQWSVSKRTVAKKTRVAYGPYKRAWVKGALSYGTRTKGKKIRKIPAWVIAGAPSAKAYADSKYDRPRARIASTRERIAKTTERTFAAKLEKLAKRQKALESKQERQLRLIREGKSIMSPNKKRKRRSKGKRKTKRSASKRTRTYRAKRGGVRKGKRAIRKSKRTRRSKAKNRKRTYTVSSPRAVRSKRARRKAKRRGGKGTKRTIKSRATAKRTRKVKKGVMRRGILRFSHTFRSAKGKTTTKRYVNRYKARKGSTGSVHLIPPGAAKRRSSQRMYNFTANKKRKTIRRRRGFRRNGAFAPVVEAFKASLPIFGGFAAHRVGTAVIASAVGSFLPVPEGFKVPLVGILLAGIGSVATAAAVKGPAKPLIMAGMALSSLAQLVTAGLRAAGQEGAVSYLAGLGVIPTQNLTAYGSYELVGGMSGFGALPYAQALAGLGALPYAQALAGSPYAARGNYLDRPSLGAFPEQALAAYPEQAAAGYGSYELTSEGGVLNGLGTSPSEIEQALNIADSNGSVGFGADSIGRESILIPDGAQGVISQTPELPLTAGSFGSNIFGTSFG